MSDLSCRPFTSADFEQCAKLAAQAWPVGSHLTSERESWRLMGPYIDIAAGWSNWKELACDDGGRLIGLLFGEVRGRTPRGRKPMGTGWNILASELKVHSRFVLGRYGQVKNLHRVLRSFGMTELKLIINRPEADAEVNLFLVKSEDRGKGIGTMLMNRFVAAARGAGSRRVSVYADDKASHWEFYEHYGFQRTGTFYDNWSSYYNLIDSYGIRLAMDLDNGPAD